MFKIPEFTDPKFHLLLARCLLFIVRWLSRLVSATAEVLLHRNFGRRYLPILVLSPLVYLFFAAAAPSPSLVRSLFFVLLLVRSIGHCAFAFRRRRFGLPEPHSMWTGDPWNIWRQSSLSQSAVRNYAEPALCCVTGILLMPVDPFLGGWWIFASFGLFIRQMITGFKLWRHVADAADARLEAEQLNRRLNTYLQPTTGAATRTYRARLPHSSQRRP